MRKLFLSALFCSPAFISSGQIIPNTSTSPASVSGVHTPPSAYDAAMKVNFIRSWEASRPFAADTSVTSSIRTIQEVKQVTQYFDGLGRPLQIVAKQITPGGRDMVSANLYDEFGREMYKYLPYVPIDSNINNGKFKRNPFNEQASFFSNTTYNPGLTGEQVYYSKTVFEASPLNRIDTSFAPGNSWGGSHVGIVTGFQINTAADSVRIWRIDSSNAVSPTSTAYYPAGALYKNVTKDEHGKQVIEYKDKQGMVILKKVQIDASPSAHHSGWFCTYYIYDDLNNLRFVIQPLGTDALKNRGWTFENSLWKSSTIAKELCFIYEYDSRQRMILKKVPGAGEVWMVYDARDRLVMVQDSLQRENGNWLYTKYDALNRPVLTGLWENSNDRAYHQGQAGSSTGYPNPGSNYEILTETYYDDYGWTGSAGLSSTLITTYTSNTNYFYSPSNTSWPYPQSITPYYITTGMATGTKVKVLGSESTYLYTASFFDDRGRLIQTHSTNYSGGKDTITLQYSFDGRLLRNLLCHAKSGTNAQRYIVLTKNEYDAGGRMTKLSKKAGNSPEVVLAENSYDELGQLQKKKIGRKRDETNQNTYTANAIDSLVYTYNIRGWLRGINKDYARALGGAEAWFGMELNYDFGFTEAQLNGNIAGMRWRSRGDGEQRAYGFSYDAANRFLKADFTQYTGSSWNTTTGIDFSVKDMSYDANGNILSMTQKAWKLGGSSVIDSLAYTYITGSNRLLKVVDAVSNPNTRLGDFHDGTNGSNEDYAYDGNGNLITDNNKTIIANQAGNGIRYNHLNLPSYINVYSKGNIEYVYDAAGNKLKKLAYDISTDQSTVTTYLGAFIYQNDTLQFISHEEGRIRARSNGASDTMYYDFFHKDHLGNVRMVLTDELRTDAYPAATMETGNAEIENLYYSNIEQTRDERPGYEDNYTDPNDYAARLLGIAERSVIGPAMALKVMAGDRFNVRVSSFYKTGDPPGPPMNPLDDLLNNLTSSISNLTLPSHGISEEDLVNSGVFVPGVTSFLNSQTYNSSRPKAYINWILFDERFQYVSSGSGFEQVGNNNELTIHVHNNLTIVKSGYLYIWTSNATEDVDVFFDNLQAYCADRSVCITHIRGPLIEETHYYPFGLAMSGISSKALNFGDPENKKKFNGIEHTTDLDLNQYDAFYRNADPQIGRWWQIDPKPNVSISSYAMMENNPILRADPLGDTVIFHGPDAKKAAKALDRSSSLKIKYDKKTGHLSATGTAKTAYDQKLLDAITDKNVEVNVTTTRANQVTLKNGNITGDLVVGAFGGSTVDANGKVITDQVINIKHMKAEQSIGGLKVGNNVFHETIESYIAGKNNPGTIPTQGNNQAYLNAHNAANALDPNYSTNIVYGFDPATKSYYVQKVATVGGITVVLDSKVIYKK